MPVKEEKRFGFRRPDAEELKEILNIVADKVPGLLDKLSNLLYSPESAKKIGKAVATFYQELVNGGLGHEQAFKLTKEYMAALNPGTVVGNLGGLGRRFSEGDEDVD
jgi:hypothetical protein